ncbi:MAG: hypothetical protein QM802_24505 [Agriterribacter sp.]
MEVKDLALRIHQIISFLSSLTVTAVITSIIGVCFLFITFNLAGGETLDQAENANIIRLIVSVLILINAIFISRGYINRNKKYTAYGIIVFPLIVVVMTTAYLIDQNFYHTKFNKTVWGQSECKPERMAKGLVKEKILIGMTRAQVKQMLGNGTEQYEDTSSDKSSMLYLVKNDWTLIVFFEDDKVVKAELRLPFLCV